MADKKNNNPFSDLSLEGMSKYSAVDAQAKRVQRAHELDERIREFAAREKTAAWIDEAPIFCERETLANKDVFDLSKEAYRLPLLVEEAAGLRKLALEKSEEKKRAEAKRLADEEKARLDKIAADERARLAKIEAENRAKLASMEAAAKEKETAERLAREAKERENAAAARDFDGIVERLQNAPRNEMWCAEVDKECASLASLPTEVKLLVKLSGALDRMATEAKEYRRAAKEKAEKEAAEAEKKRADAAYAAAREKAEREAEAAKIENEKKIAKAKADAEAARIAAEREAEAERERAEREAEAARIENERRVAKAKADAEAARIAAEREAEAERERAEREAEAARIENERRLAQATADAEADRIRAERAMAAAREKAAREAEEARIENERRIAQAKADAEAARIKAESDAKAAEEARIRREREGRDRLARIEAEAKEKALKERLRREEKDRHDREAAADMDSRIGKLDKAPRTKLWISEVKLANAELEGLSRDAKLMVAGLDLLEAMVAEANGRELAASLDKQIEELYVMTRDGGWAIAVEDIFVKIDFKSTSRVESYLAARPYMSKLQTLEEMHKTAEPMALDERSRRFESERDAEERRKKEAEKERKRLEAEAAAEERKRFKETQRAEKERRRAEAAERRRERMEKFKSALMSGLRKLGISLLFTAVAVVAVVLSLVFPQHMIWFIPSAVAVALILLERISKTVGRLSFVINIIMLLAGIIIAIVGFSNRAILPISVVAGIYVFLSGVIGQLYLCLSEHEYEDIALIRYFDRASTKSLVMMVCSAVLTGISLAMLVTGNAAWLTMGITLGCAVTVITLLDWLRWETFANPNSYANASVLMAIFIPVAAFVLAFTGQRVTVFAGLMVIGGYFLGNAIKLVTCLARGGSFSDCFDMSEYDRGVAPVVAGTLVLALCLIMFFGYIGYTDYVVDGEGTLTHCYERGETVLIPEGTKVIGAGAMDRYCHCFSVEKKLTKRLVIPEGVTEIEGDAFFWTRGIEEIYLPKSLEKISAPLLVGANKKLKIYYAGDEIPEWLGGKDGEGRNVIVHEKTVTVQDGLFQSHEEVQYPWDIEWVLGYDYTTEFYGEGTPAE